MFIRSSLAPNCGLRLRVSMTALFTPVAATLVTYIALGGLAFTLRDAPDGYIATSVTDFISKKVGPVPLAFVVFVLCALLLEELEHIRASGVPLRRPKGMNRFGAILEAVAHHEGGDATGDLDILDCPPDLAPRIVDGLAVVEGDQLGKFLEVGFHEVLEAEQRARSLDRWRGTPCREGGLGNIDGMCNVGRGGDANLGDGMPGSRIGDWCASARRVGPVTADVIPDKCGDVDMCLGHSLIPS